jgi:hypothetical protein
MPGMGIGLPGALVDRCMRCVTLTLPHTAESHSSLLLLELPVALVLTADHGCAFGVNKIQAHHVLLAVNQVTLN